MTTQPREDIYSTHTVVIPTSETDHNWCEWMVVNTTARRMSTRDDNDEVLQVHKRWVDAWYASHGEDDYLGENYGDYEPLAQELRNLGYTVLYPAHLQWTAIAS